MAFFSSGTSDILLPAQPVYWPLSEKTLLPWGCPLHFRVEPGASPHAHPTSPQHSLAKCLPGPGSRWHSVLMTPTFCLSLQPLSPAGVLSSTSTASNRSRNRPRYRTKALSSEVDESLFGGIKVTLTLPLQGDTTWTGVSEDEASTGQVTLRTKGSSEAPEDELCHLVGSM